MLGRIRLAGRGGTSGTIRTAIGPVLFSALVICAGFALSSVEIDRGSRAAQLSQPTQPHFSLFSDPTVTLTCENGKILENPGKNEATICSNEKTSMSFGTGSYQLGASGDSGYTFSGWSTSGDVSISGDTLTVSGAGGVTAAFSACTAPSIGTPSPQVRNGYQQAWVNWSYSNGVPSFSWTANGVSLAAPTINAGSDSASINLNDLTAGTTYDYTASVEGACGINVQESGSFSTASSMLTIDGSSATFENDSKTVSTELSTSLSHDLIIAQVVSSTNPGYVTKCSDSESLSWSQRTNYTPTSASPWEFIWSAEASAPLSSDSITCTYSTTGNFGLIVFGVANAYLASPFDNGSGIPCKAQGVPTASCKVTTTDPDDMLLGLVASYHTSGSPAITPGSGFTQINQEDVGPYGMAEFSGIESTPGTYTISATDSGVSGMAIVGDALQAAAYEGWVSNMTANGYLLDQIGSPLQNASVWPAAQCGFEAAPGDYIVESSSFTGSTASASGFFQLHESPYVRSWTQEGPHYVGYTETQTLNGGGNCVTTDSLGDSPYTVSQSHIVLWADRTGSWNATDYVGSTSSPTNDYQQFGLESNGIDVAATAVAFIHTQYAECQITTSTGMSQTVSSFLAGSGYSYSSGNSTTQTNLQPYGNDSSVAWHYTTSGVMNETSGAIVSNSYAVSGPYGLILGEPFTDPDSAPPNTSTRYTVTVYPGGLIDGESWFNGGNYTSTSGLDMSVGLSGGWGGESIGPGAYVDLSYTTSEQTSSQKEIYCSFEDPSSTEPSLFYFWADGSETSIGAAINVHIWFDEVE